MENAKRHTFMVLTKRPERMLSWIKGYDQWLYHAGTMPFINRHPNVWLGVSVENQQAANERIPLLLQTPAAVRFISAEPLLGPVDLEEFLQYPPFHDNYKFTFGETEWRGLDWVICGGESGPGARVMHPDWARELRDLCQDAEKPFFFKQWGEWLPDDQLDASNRRDPMTESDMTWVRVGKKAAGRQLDGKEWNEFPEVK
jgi:protein gp37